MTLLQVPAPGSWWQDTERDITVRVLSVHAFLHMGRLTGVVQYRSARRVSEEQLVLWTDRFTPRAVERV